MKASGLQSNRSRKKEIAGVEADQLTQQEALDEIERRMEKKIPFCTMFVNLDVVLKAESDEKLKMVLNRSELTFVDGMPLVWLSHLHGNSFPERVAGSDLVPSLCQRAAEREWSIFILGGAPGVPEKAAQQLKQRYPKICIKGVYSPPQGFENDEKEIENILSRVKKAAPEILIVCFGCPKQEYFVSEYYKKCGAVLSICGGATVDFMAGNLRRCPKWMGDAGLEWLFRLIMEPRRLFKRYLFDGIYFFILAFRYWPGRKRRKNRAEEV